MFEIYFIILWLTSGFLASWLFFHLLNKACPSIKISYLEICAKIIFTLCGAISATMLIIMIFVFKTTRIAFFENRSLTLDELLSGMF